MAGDWTDPVARDILAAATAEFAAHGLAGARVDAIAAHLPDQAVMSAELKQALAHGRDERADAMKKRLIEVDGTAGELAFRFDDSAMEAKVTWPDQEPQVLLI